MVAGSLVEGWPTAIVEALACGKPVVTTEVSGARELVLDGRNGFVVTEREPERFARAMLDALSLPGAGALGVEIARRHALSTLGPRLGRLWAPLAPAAPGGARAANG